MEIYLIIGLSLSLIVQSYMRFKDNKGNKRIIKALRGYILLSKALEDKEEYENLDDSIKRLREVFDKISKRETTELKHYEDNGNNEKK